MSQVATIDRQPRSVLMTMADRYGMEPGAFEATVRATCMPGQNVSKEQFAAFLLVAKEHDLNPILKEIYAFPTRGGGIQPIVGVDGWANLVNSHPECDGIEFEDALDGNGNLTAITCRIYRKDRSRPTCATEYMAECRRNTDTWKQWPRRMLRHKALIQAARYAFGFSGIIEPDEWERSQESGQREAQADRPKSLAGRLDALASSAPENGNEAEDVPDGEVIEHEGSQPAADDAEQANEGGDDVDDSDERPLSDEAPAEANEADDAGADLDPEAWLSDLEQSLAACEDQDTLDQVWNEKGEATIEAHNPFPPDVQAARALYTKHSKRVAG